MPNAVTNFQTGWQGGSCSGIAFKDSLVFAATYDRGVLWLDTAKGEAATWHAPLLECGLPIRDSDRIFYPIDAITSLSGQKYVFAGGRRGIFRSEDGGTNYSSVSQKTFADKVTLPATWLFCSGEFDVEVVSGE